MTKSLLLNMQKLLLTFLYFLYNYWVILCWPLFKTKTLCRIHYNRNKDNKECKTIAQQQQQLSLHQHQQHYQHHHKQQQQCYGNDKTKKINCGCSAGGRINVVIVTCCCPRHCCCHLPTPTLRRRPAAGLTRYQLTMGNSQTSHANADDAAVAAAGTKSRRESRVKVFARFGQKKSATKEATNAATHTSEDTNNIDAAAIDGDDDADFLRQSHAAVIRQLEIEQMDFRKEQKPPKKKLRFFCRRKENDDDDVELQQPVEVEKKTMQRHKRPAPKPPTNASNENIVETTTNQAAIATATKRAETCENDQANYNNTKDDPRAFIENLFADVDLTPTKTTTKIETPITTTIAADIGSGCGEEQQIEDVLNAATAADKATTPVLEVEMKEEQKTINVKNLKTKQNLTNTHAEKDNLTVTTTTTTAIKNKSATDVSSSTIPATGSDNNKSKLLEMKSSDVTTTMCSSMQQAAEKGSNSSSSSNVVLKNVMHERNDDVDDDDDDSSYDNNLTFAGHDMQNCNIIVLKEMSSSSDSLFTDPLSPRSLQSETGVPYEIGHDVCDNLRQTHKFPKTFARGLNELPLLKKERPISEISIASAETSGILSPITARAIYELQRRHRADKLAQLSISKITFLDLQEVPTTATTTNSSPELETESADEQMALQLGKKLAQVLSNNAVNNSSAAVSNNAATPTTCDDVGNHSSPTTTNNAAMLMGAATNEIFNIAKAKKIELQNLSSRLTPAPAPVPPTTTPEAEHNAASPDSKQLPPSAENQSTVIISFKSSQTPVQSQQQQQQNFATTTTEAVSAESIAAATPPLPCTTTSTTQIASTIPHSSSAATATATATILTHCNNNNAGTPPPAPPSSNVLKKVASFTVEKSAAGTASGSNTSVAATSNTTHLEHINNARRLSYVPEKLSFAAYEKFEGQMLMKWLIAALQSNCGNSNSSGSTNNFNEHDLNALTLQYCNNLLNIGVLKQIADKNVTETFSPFQMYQWTYTEAPISSLPLTPGKLDKSSAWPYSSTPSAVVRVTKNIQTDILSTADLQLLRKRLLICTTMTEVHGVVNEMLNNVGELQRRPSKRCTQLVDLLNASEATIYEYDKSLLNANVSKERLETGVQTEVTLENGGVCCTCGRDSGVSTLAARETCEMGTQTVNEEEKTKKVTAAPAPIPPPMPQTSFVAPAPPPPPPPMPQTSFVAPAPPPPPPPPCPGPPPPPAQPPPPPPPVLKIDTSLVPPPPPPGAPKPPTSTTPAPLPNPAESMWFNQANALRKSAVNPPKPMKPLYWTRIVTPTLPPKIPAPVVTATDSAESSSSSPDDVSDSAAPKEIWQEIEETSLDNIDEFTELFSRQAIVPVTKPKEKKELRIKTMKVLDSKRSQNVGIVSRSLHVDFCEIEHAIYHVDTSVVSLETLQQIINIKATNEELELIKEAAQSHIPLDHPEQFLLKISQISMSTERISCIVFQAEFEEASTLIERKLEVVQQLSQYLLDSEDLKLVFTIILTLGNYMNGGNRQRGQADGFTLEILGKLKDVKSKESQTTLLHFIVRTYISLRRKEGVQLLEIPLPIPEPSDVERAAQVDFDDIKQQISELNKKVNACKKTTEKVMLASTNTTLQPFKDKMEEFIESASKTIEKLYKDLDECRDMFIDTMRFYRFIPKSRTLEQCTPDQFFEYWTNFTNDFKDIWKKEIAMLWNELLKKSKQIQTRKNIKTKKLQPGGLKDRIMRLRKN